MFLSFFFFFNIMKTIWKIIQKIIIKILCIQNLEMYYLSLKTHVKIFTSYEPEMWKSIFFIISQRKNNKIY